MLEEFTLDTHRLYERGAVLLGVARLYGEVEVELFEPPLRCNAHVLKRLEATALLVCAAYLSVLGLVQLLHLGLRAVWPELPELNANGVNRALVLRKGHA